MEVTSEEEVHDGNVLKKLVKGTSENNEAGGGVRRVLAGGGAFTYVCTYIRTASSFQFLADCGIYRCCNQGEEDSSGKSNGCCYPRKLAVLHPPPHPHHLSDFDRWKCSSVSYGHR